MTKNEREAGVCDGRMSWQLGLAWWFLRRSSPPCECVISSKQVAPRARGSSLEARRVAQRCGALARFFVNTLYFFRGAGGVT